MILQLNKVNITSSEVDIINKLIDPKKLSSLDPYIISAFDGYRRNKTQISIVMMCLDVALG